MPDLGDYAAGLRGSSASETPAIDGERIYVLVGNVGVFAHGLDGRPSWTWRMTPRPSYLDFGTASSPVVHEGRVFVLHDNQEESGPLPRGHPHLLRMVIEA